MRTRGNGRLRHVIRRAHYNYEIVLWDRWRIPTAPAYGWRNFLRQRLGRS